MELTSYYLISFLVLATKTVEIGNNDNLLSPLSYLSSTLDAKSKEIILLLMNNSSATEEQLVTMEIVRHHPHFLVAIILENDINKLENFKLSLQSPLVVYKILLSSETNTLEILRQISTMKTNNNESLWTQNIVQIPHETFATFEQRNIFKNLSILFNFKDRPRIFLPSEQSDSILEIFSINDVTIDEFIPKGLYSYRDGSQYNFRGASIRATAVDAPMNFPVVTYDESSKEPKFVRGLGVFDLWDIRDSLNFTVIAMKGDEDIDVDEANNSLPVVGIGRQLYEGEADVSILHSYHSPDNARYLKPLVAMGADRVYAIFRQPPSFSVRNAFSKPFTTEAWILIIFTWLIITSFLFIFTMTLQRLHFVRKRNESNYATKLEMQTLEGESLEKWQHEETLLWIVAAFCQRSYFWIPNSISLRCLFICSLLWSLVIYSLYSAHIISSFTAEFLPIRRLRDLIEQNFQIISDPKQFFSYAFMSNSKESSKGEKEAYGIKLGESFTSDVDAVKQVTEGYIMHFNTLDNLFISAKELNYSDEESCNLFYYIPLGKLELTSGFYVPKNSPFQEPFNLKLVLIMERGLNARYIRNYYEETLTKCPKITTRYREDLSMADVVSAFIIYICGCAFSFVALFFEIQIWKILYMYKYTK